MDSSQVKKYLSWDRTTLDKPSDDAIEEKYNDGFLFGRVGKGVMDQTRSVRIDLSKFEPSSENRRVLRKTESVSATIEILPYQNYHWKIGKLGKDFYDQKFGEKTFSANKIKEILTDPNESNFNRLLVYKENEAVGYSVILETKNIVHYCYPFYDLQNKTSNLGLGMMIKAIIWAKQNGKKYIYLGSAQRPTDTYKLQFKGIEWFDGKTWKEDQKELKSTI